MGTFKNSICYGRTLAQNILSSTIQSVSLRIYGPARPRVGRDGKGSKLESNIPGWAQGTYKLSGEREVVMCVYTHQNARAECQSERITLQVVQEEE